MRISGRLTERYSPLFSDVWSGQLLRQVTQSADCGASGTALAWLAQACPAITCDPAAIQSSKGRTSAVSTRELARLILAKELGGFVRDPRRKARAPMTSRHGRTDVWPKSRGYSFMRVAICCRARLFHRGRLGRSSRSRGRGQTPLIARKTAPGVLLRPQESARVPRSAPARN
jgi:hypothetical protein